MNVVALTPPGRFPTVVNDPGDWWSALAESGAHHLRWFSANAEWWRALCGPAAARMAEGGLRSILRLGRRTDLSSAAAAAAVALEAMRDPSTYTASSRYIETVTPLAKYLTMLNDTQRDLWFSLEGGVRVLDLDYDDSSALVEYARPRTPLSDLIAASLADCPRDIDLLVVNVTSPEDLLTAVIAVRLLQAMRPRLHACLAGHSYESFSLIPHIDDLRQAGTLDSIFDSIIETANDRDLVVPALAHALAAGRAPRGYLTRSHLEVGIPPRSQVVPPPAPTYAPEPIFRTRLRPEVPTGMSEIMKRLNALSAGGYRSFIFPDEQLSPSFLDEFSRSVLASALSLRWACRCTFDQSLTPELFRQMREAGCYEVHFNLGSTSLQTRQRKGIEAVDSTAVAANLRDAAGAGVGLHVVILVGFPGQTAAELRDSVEFVIRAVSKAANVTVWLRPFVPFAGAQVMTDPPAYGIIPAEPEGDIPSAYAYWTVPEFEDDAREVEAVIPEVEDTLMRGLGWDRFGTGPGPWAALRLYFVSGHGAILKTLVSNPFANPLREAAAGSQ